MSRGPEPQAPTFTDPWTAPVTTPTVTNPLTAPQWAQNPRAFEVFDPKSDPLAQARIDAKSLWDISTYLSAQNQNPLNVSAFNAITGFLTGFRGSGFDQQALGEQGKAGQQTDLATQLGRGDISPEGIDPGAAQYGVQATDLASQLGTQNISAPTTETDTTPWGSVFEGAAPPAQDLASQLGIESIDTTPWGSVFEAPAQDPNYAAVFEGAAPEADPSAGGRVDAFIRGNVEADPSGRVDAFIPGGRETDFDYQTTAASPAPEGEPTYDTTMESGRLGEQPTTDDATTRGSDPALSGYPADPAAAAAALGQPTEGQPGTPGGQPGAPTAPAAGGQTFAVSQAVTDVANAASNAALSVDAPAAAVDAAGTAAYNAALNGASPAVQASDAGTAALQAGATQQQADVIASATLAAATNPTAVPPAQPQQAPPGPEQPGAPQGQQAPSITSAITGDRQTDFQYGPQAAPPSLVEQSQQAPPQAPPAQPPGLVDMQPSVPMPQARSADAPQPGPPGGIGSDIVASRKMTTMRPSPKIPNRKVTPPRPARRATSPVNWSVKMANMTMHTPTLRRAVGHMFQVAAPLMCKGVPALISVPSGKPALCQISKFRISTSKIWILG